jgi:transcriptional regulator with XRE-family HTH domain
VARVSATFVDKLQRLREAVELTQYSLAKKAGLSRQALSRLELGERAPSWETVQKLAKALSVSCEAFAEVSEAAPPQAKQPHTREQKRQRKPSNP